MNTAVSYIERDKCISWLHDHDLNSVCVLHLELQIQSVMVNAAAQLVFSAKWSEHVIPLLQKNEVPSLCSDAPLSTWHRAAILCRDAPTDFQHVYMSLSSVCRNAKSDHPVGQHSAIEHFVWLLNMPRTLFHFC